MHQTAARSPDDMMAGIVSAIDRSKLIQYFAILQRESLGFATYICDNADRPGSLLDAEQIVGTIEISRSVPPGYPAPFASHKRH